MDKYPAARFIGNILRFAGWAAVVIGFILFIAGLSSLGGNNGIGAITAIPKIIGGMILAINGLLVAAAGELIKVFLDIEGNTAESVNQLRALKNSAQTAVSNYSSPIKTPLRATETNLYLWKFGDGREFLTPESQSIVRQAAELGYRVEYDDGREIRFIKGESVDHSRSNFDVLRFGKFMK